jgi:membrane protein implicated in regulation of membrane protease activity
MHDHNHGHWFPIGALLGVALCFLLNGMAALWKMLMMSGIPTIDLPWYSLATLAIFTAILGVCCWKKQD